MPQAEFLNRKMTQSSFAHLFLSLCLPSVAAAVLPSVVGMSDTLLASRIGADVCSVIGLTFPVHAAIQTIGFVFGTGAGSLAATALGEKNQQKANLLASGALWLSLLVSSLFALLCLCFLSPLVTLLGATEALAQNAKAYLLFLLPSSPLLCLCFLLSNLLRAEGKAARAMLGLACGNLLSVLLSWALCFFFHFGIAALGLSIPAGYLLTAIFLLLPYWKKQCAISLSLPFSKQEFCYAGKAVLNGLPSLFRQGLTVVAALLLNRAAKSYGNEAISAISITGRIFLLFYAIPLGIGQGIIPAVGYNLGNQNFKKAKSLYLAGMASASLLLLFTTVPAALFAGHLFQLFGKETALLDAGAAALRGICLVLPLHGVIAITNLLLQVRKKPVAASLLAAARNGVFFLPLIFWLPKQFGFTGILLTQPLADGFTFLLALWFAILFFKHTKQRPD